MPRRLAMKPISFWLSYKFEQYILEIQVESTRQDDEHKNFILFTQGTQGRPSKFKMLMQKSWQTVMTSRKTKKCYTCTSRKIRDDK